MARTNHPARRWRARVLTGLAAPLLLPWAGALAAEPPAAAPAPAVAAAQPLTLDEALRVALASQPAIAAARASLAAADAQQRGLSQLRVPTILVRELPLRRRQSALGVTVASAGLTQAEWDTRYAVSRTYFGVLYARAQQRTAGDVVSHFRFYLERTRELVKKGESRDLTTNTLDKINVYLRLAEGRAAEAERGIERAKAALREAMGLAQDCPVEVAEVPLSHLAAEVNRDYLIQLALCRRGELMQAAAVEEVTRLEVEAQRVNHGITVPTFASVVDIHARPIPQGFNNGEYRPGAVGLEYPTTFAGPKSARVERAGEFHSRAVSVVEKTRNLIALETVDTYLKWEEASKRAPQARDGARAARRLAENTQKDFISGQGVKIDEVLTNEVLAGQGRAAYNEALYQLAISLAGLERVTAGGFLADYNATVPEPPHDTEKDKDEEKEKEKGKDNGGKE